MGEAIRLGDVLVKPPVAPVVPTDGGGGASGGGIGLGQALALSSLLSRGGSWQSRLGWYSDFYRNEPTKDEIVGDYVRAVKAADSPREERECLNVYTSELVRLGYSRKNARSILRKALRGVR